MKLSHLAILGVLVLVSAAIGFWLWSQDSRDQLSDEQIESGLLKDTTQGQARRVQGTDEAAVEGTEASNSSADSSTEEAEGAEAESEDVKAKSVEQGIRVSFLLQPGQEYSAWVYLRRNTSRGRSAKEYLKRCDSKSKHLFGDLTNDYYSVWTPGIGETLHIEVENGRIAEVEFDLRKAHWISGRVETPQGQPIFGASIYSERLSTLFSSSVVAKGDESGQFLTPINYKFITVLARKAGHAASNRAFHEWIEGAENSIKLVMPGPEATLRGSTWLRACLSMGHRFVLRMAKTLCKAMHNLS